MYQLIPGYPRMITHFISFAGSGVKAIDEEYYLGNVELRQLANVD